MISSQFDPSEPYLYVTYLRMSSDKQNPRSPDQQLKTIQETLARRGLPWKLVKIYRDDAVTGRYSSRRPGYQRMIQDLKSGKVHADLVLVDTFERLTRAKSASAEREKFRRMGLLILSALNQFEDPTTMQGRALAAMEDYRSSAEGEAKAHHVLRGKRDAIRRGRWPGGAPPLGYKLEHIVEGAGRRAGDAYSKLVPDLETLFIVQEAFRLADVLGYGANRIAAALNEDPRIPEGLKPLHAATVGNMLDSPIYMGDIVWAKNATDIVDDVRLLKERREDEWEHHKGFCESLVSEDVWNRVRDLRKARGERVRQAREAAKRRRGIPGIHSPGIALKYPLTGLVRCQHCGRAMTPSSSSPFVTQSGEAKRYVAYTCPAAPSKVCSNRTRIPEDWLRETVSLLVRKRLFLDEFEGPQEAEMAAATELERIGKNPDFRILMEDVKKELAVLDATAPDWESTLESDVAQLRSSCSGWYQSLAKPDLDPEVRSELEALVSQAKGRIAEISGELSARAAQRRSCESTLDSAEALQHLKELSSIMAGTNPSAVNVVLSQHIEGIYCDQSGKAIVRTCRLGALAGALELILETTPGAPTTNPDVSTKFVARRRARRDILGVIEDDDQADAAVDFAIDPDRFAGLDERWFHEDEFQVPRRRSWAETYAAEVAAFRLYSHSSMERTAKHFGKAVPTIREALRYARDELGIDAFGKAVSRPSLPNWAKANAREVAAFMTPGRTLKDAVVAFGKSEPTIRKALEFAKGLDS